MMYDRGNKSLYSQAIMVPIVMYVFNVANAELCEYASWTG